MTSRLMKGETFYYDSTLIQVAIGMWYFLIAILRIRDQKLCICNEPII